MLWRPSWMHSTGHSCCRCASLINASVKYHREWHVWHKRTHLDELDGQSALAHSSSSHHHQFEAFFFSTHLQMNTSPDETFLERARVPPFTRWGQRKVYTRGNKHARPFVTASNFSCSFSAAAGVSAPREDQSPCPWTDGSGRACCSCTAAPLFVPLLLAQGGTASSFLQHNSEENQCPEPWPGLSEPSRRRVPLLLVSTRCSLEQTV